MLSSSCSELSPHSDSNVTIIVPRLSSLEFQMTDKCTFKRSDFPCAIMYLVTEICLFPPFLIVAVPSKAQPGMFIQWLSKCRSIVSVALEGSLTPLSNFRVRADPLCFIPCHFANRFLSLNFQYHKMEISLKVVKDAVLD